MPDWQELVRRRLSGLALDSTDKEGVLEELAAHLEESCEEFQQRGFPEEEAVCRTFSRVGNWRELQRRIQRAKAKENFMSKRVSQFWLPSFLTLLLSMGLLMLIQLYGPSPWTVARKSGWSLIAPVAVVYIPWLLALPLIGAVGSYLSSRAGAQQKLVLVSIVFPVLPYLLFFLIGLPIAVVVDDHVAHNIMFSAFFVGFLAWVLLPALGLLAGGLPAQIYFSRRLTQRSIASH